MLPQLVKCRMTSVAKKFSTQQYVCQRIVDSEVRFTQNCCLAELGDTF